jgi:hypothetical protein
MYICSTYAVHMQYICSTYAVHMQYICRTHRHHPADCSMPVAVMKQSPAGSIQYLRLVSRKGEGQQASSASVMFLVLHLKLPASLPMTS